MGDIGRLEQLWNSLTNHVKCFFGRHEFDVFEVLFFRWEDQHDPGRFFVSGCGWCGKLMYGAKESNSNQGAGE